EAVRGSPGGGGTRRGSEQDGRPATSVPQHAVDDTGFCDPPGAIKERRSIVEGTMMTATQLRCLALLCILLLLGNAVAQPDEQSEEPDGKVTPQPNVGGHTGPITGMAFGKNGRLYTVGKPGDIQEWNVVTGERLRVWRFPQPVRRLAVSA